MEVEYRKDLHHNYMVLPKNEEITGGAYCIRMLEAEGMEGVLKLEQRLINNEVFYYYEISAMQALNILLAKAALNYDRVKQLFIELIQTIERAYEYFLNENDFVLVPEHIFMDMTTAKLFLCYLPGYNRDIMEQMAGLIEYGMNKVDYSDKEAVHLIYNLYAAVKTEGFTFDHLLEVLQTQNTLVEEVINCHNGSSRFNNVFKETVRTQEDRIGKYKTNPDIEIPVMMEQITGEQEIPCYPLKTYIYTATCCIGTILILFIGFRSGIIYNSLRTRIDYSKLSALLLILLCVTGYLMRKVWNKKNKITKIITNHEYIDPRNNLIQESIIGQVEPLSTEKEYQIEGASCSEANEDEIDMEEACRPLVKKIEGGNDEEFNPTCLLNAAEEENIYLLKPLEESVYKTIRLENFPFFIGKLKKNVDYCLKKDVVSRYHAKITKDQDKIFITDLNSTNGTFINNQELQSYQIKEIIPGDEIAFADIKYLFCLNEGI